MQNLREKKKEQGITLVEVIVVMALVALLMIPIYTLMDTNNKISERTSDLIIAKTIAVAVQDFLEEELRYAHSVSIDSAIKDEININLSDSPITTISKKAYSIEVESNELKWYTTASPRTERTILDESYMQGLDVAINFFAIPKTDVEDYQDRISLVISVSKVNGIEYTLGPTTILIENANSGIRIEGTSGSVVNYTLPD